MFTGYTDIDMLLNNNDYPKGSLITIGGCPGIGKTNFACNIIFNLCKNSKPKIEIFSLKLTEKMYIKRFEFINPEKAEKLESIFINDDPYTSIVEIEKLVKENKPEYVFIDSINAICDKDFSIEDTIIRLKKLAQESNTTIFVISGLNHDVIERKDHTPKITDLAAPKNLAQISDMVILLHSEHYYDAAKERSLETIFPRLNTVVTLKYDRNWQISDNRNL